MRNVSGGAHFMWVQSLFPFFWRHSYVPGMSALWHVHVYSSNITLFMRCSCYSAWLQLQDICCPSRNKNCWEGFTSSQNCTGTLCMHTVRCTVWLSTSTQYIPGFCEDFNWLSCGKWVNLRETDFTAVNSSKTLWLFYASVVLYVHVHNKEIFQDPQCCWYS